MTKYVQDTYINDVNLEFTYHMHLNLTLIDLTFSAAEIKHNFLCKPSVTSLFLLPVIKAHRTEKIKTKKFCIMQIVFY